MPNPSASINLGGVRGRYVRIQLPFAGYLSLAEVQVFGAWAATLPNLALGKTATQSSTAWPAAAAVDGTQDGNFLNGSVTHTYADPNAWWQVDLGVSAMINTIQIWNRTDCCGSRLSNYWVFISNTPFTSGDTPATLQNRAGTWSSYQTVPPNPTVSINAAGARGRYVRIQLAGADYLSLAEVQIFGS
jgi:hypothetical protein